MHRPIIRSELGHYVEKGKDFTLSCEQTFPLKADFDMGWLMSTSAKVGIPEAHAISSNNNI